MDDVNFPYRVVARSNVGNSVNAINIYDAQTIDEACAVGLGYYRNCNVRGVEFVITSLVPTYGEIVIFKHE